MTAYGRGQAPAGEGGSWVVELRTVNSRFLDLHLRMPPGLAGLEDRIKKYLEGRLARGRVNLFIKPCGAAEPAPRLVLNRPLVREYRRVLEELRQELGISDPPGLETFLSQRDLVLAEEADPDLDRLWSELEPALEQCLEGVEAMRAREGESLARDLARRLDRLEELFDQVTARTPEILENYRQRLNQRIAQLLENPDQVDPQRIAQEVAILADKADITEEAVRARSHLAQFRRMLASPGPVGRKLDFLLQELNREANTMASKSPDADAAQQVVEIKAELERIREQVQNLE